MPCAVVNTRVFGPHDRAPRTFASPERMRKIPFRPIGCSVLLLGAPQVFPQQDHPGYDLLRVENEYKIDVPAGTADTLWAFLRRTFGNEHLFLRSFDSTFRSTTATDRSVDRYFDDARMQLLLAGNGVRFRSRQVLSDTTDPKNGRRLIQVKINHVDAKALDRGEFKYAVALARPDPRNTDPLDRHPFLGLVAPEQRAAITARLKGYGIAADSLRPTILIEQWRRRIYVERGGAPFATLTVDSVQARFGRHATGFVELELELNEKRYTGSDTSERAYMERLNTLVKDTILRAFPALHQDQTPKYRKAYDRLGLNGFTRPRRVRDAWPLVGGGVLTILLLVLAARRRRARAAT